MTQAWQFYGRQSELQTLDTFVRSDEPFSTLAIWGRRQVGKTALINQFCQHYLDASDTRVFVVCSLQRTISGTHRFHENLHSAIQIADLSLLKGYIRSDDPYNDFTGMAYHILERGHILVIDEFQRIGNDGSQYLESVFQEYIDRLGNISRPRSEGWKPRLIVMGSEQQRLVEMFKHPTAPMFGRIYHVIHVKPWSFAEFREVVEDQGWDTEPNRLLSLWTAYNGLPGHWQRFSRARHLSDFSRIPDDTDWTRRFLEIEEIYRKSPDGPFQNQMEVELRPSDLAIVRWLASQPSGYSIETDLRHRDHRPVFDTIKTALRKEQPGEDLTDADISDKVHDVIRKRLSGEHLGLLRSRAPLNSEGKVKWSVADHFARFQLRVLEPFADVAHVDAGESDVLDSDRLGAFRSIEGYGLEIFASTGLRFLFEIGTDVLPAGQAKRTRLYTSLERKDIPGDFDIFLVHHQKHPTSPANHDGDRHFWIGSAKRSAGEFCQTKKRQDGSLTTTIWNDIKRLNIFLKPLSVGDALTQAHFQAKWKKEVNFVVISRSFTDAEKAAIAQEIANIFAADCDHGIDHVYSMDISDILSRRGPQPLKLDL